MSDKPEALKPCPFCGGKADGPIKDPRAQWINWYLVYCREGDPCGTLGPARRTKAEAIASWNTRASDSARAELELLRRREIQMLGAGLSKRNWHETEAAYNQARDRLDNLLTALRSNAGKDQS